MLKKQPSVLHLVTVKPYLYGGLASRLAKIMGWRGKTIITVAGLGRLFSKERSASAVGRALQAFVHPFMVAATKHATVFFETQHDKQFWLNRGIIQEHQARVTNGTGLDLGQFTPAEPELNNDKVMILFAGRLIRNKGLDVLMLAAKELEDIEGIEFCVAGEAHAEDRDCVSADELTKASNIKYLGVVENMPALLAQTTIVALPSRYNEGVPRILIEGAACGCVLAATDFPGSAVLIKDGETGFIIKGTSIEEQAKHLAKIILNLQKNKLLCKNIGEAASNFVKTRGFDISDVKIQFVDAYLGREKKKA